jgi:hypothetical protein
LRKRLAGGGHDSLQTMAVVGFTRDSAGHCLLIEELHGKTLGVHPHDFAAPLDLTLVLGKGSRHDDILPDQELGFGLDVGPAGADVFNFSFKKPAVGCEMGVFGTLDSRVSTNLAIL